MFTTRPEILGSFGCVASTHWLASGAGMAVLERGGNAFDAAVAAGFVLQIVEPHLNGPGGEVPILLVTADSEVPQAICGQGAVARRRHHRALSRSWPRGDAGQRPARHVRARRLRCLAAAAARLRHHGPCRCHVLCHRLCRRTAIRWCRASSSRSMPCASMFEDEWVTSAELYLADGLPKPFSLFRNPDLAATWRRLLREAEAAGGNRERQIDAARRGWSPGLHRRDHRRLLPHHRCDGFIRPAPSRRADRRRHGQAGKPRSRRRSATTITATASSNAASWSQGPVFLQQLALLKNFDLAAMDPLGAGLRPYGDGMRQARLRRSRGLSTAIRISSKCR